MKDNLEEENIRCSNIEQQVNKTSDDLKHKINLISDYQKMIIEKEDLEYKNDT